MIAICSMIRNPFNFNWWLDYHLNIGVDYIFLEVEDTPELKTITDKYPNVITNYKSDVNRKNNYLTLIDRQKIFVEGIKSKLIDLDIKWIIHIDSDELVCCSGELKKLLDEVPDNYQTVRFTNYEAVYDSDTLENVFLETSKFRYGQYRISYKNGKSAGRVNDELKVKSPHKFFGNRLYYPEIKISILHYESANFDNWYTKFNQDFDQDKFEEIPFEFYKKSIDVIKSGDKELARQYYNKMKVGVTDGVIKLSWAPNFIERNIVWSK